MSANSQEIKKQHMHNQPIYMILMNKKSTSGYLWKFSELKPTELSNFVDPVDRSLISLRDRMVVVFTTTYAISAYHH